MEQIEVIKKDTMTLENKAKQLVVKTNEDFEIAGTLLKMVKGLRKQVGNTFDPIIKANYDAHKKAIEKKKEAEAPIIHAENMIKPKMASYMQEIERKRLEEQRRLEAEARKKAEEEALAEAERLESEGAMDEVDAILDEPLEVAPIVMQDDRPKVEGVSVRQNWKFVIEDESKIPDEYKIIDERKIGAVVRALKDKANIAGVKVYCEKTIASKSA